jgi:hypothetical protein
MKTMFTLSLAAIGASASLSRELRLIGEVDIDSAKVSNLDTISFYSLVYFFFHSGFRSR